MSQVQPVSPKGVSVLGVISLVAGSFGTLVSLFPCLLAFGIVIAGLGLLLGTSGLIVSLVGKRSGIGLPIAGSLTSLVGLLVAGLWFVVIGWHAWAGKQEVAKEEREIREGPALAVSAKELQNDYDANELDGDRKYKDQILEVTGTVARVSKASFSGAAIELRTDKAATVQCHFESEQKTELEGLVPGQQVTIRGICRGNYQGVMLVRCWLKQ
jgi:hypothetical protein